MATTVLTTLNVRSAYTLLLGAGDNLIIAAGAGIYWNDGSLIGFATPAPGDPANAISIFGTLATDEVNISPGSKMFVAALGTLALDVNLTFGTTDSAGACHLINNGTISAASRTVAALVMQGGDNVIQNHGTITGIHGVMLGADSMGGNRLVNTGLISASVTAVSLLGDNDTVRNTGTLSGDHAAISVHGAINGPDPTIAIAQSIDNSGLLGGGLYGIVTDQTVAGSSLTITNSGIITGRTAAIQCGAEQDSITNTGRLNGAVYLGAGDDLLDSLGGRMNGPVHGGTGADRYITDDARLTIVETGSDIDTVDAAISFRLAAGVEVLNLLGAGNFDGDGNGSANTLTGNAGNNILTGLGGADSLYGDLGEDGLRGGSLGDLMSGGDGDDVLAGNSGDDSLLGDDGDDRLIGGAGQDRMQGGEGVDTFVFHALGQSGNSTATADVILDFDIGEDRISLRAIDADSTNNRANDSLTFIFGANFGNVAGELRFTQSGGDTYVMLDVTGDGAADGMIRLTGLITLHAADFVL